MDRTRGSADGWRGVASYLFVLHIASYAADCTMRYLRLYVEEVSVSYIDLKKTDGISQKLTSTCFVVL